MLFTSYISPGALPAAIDPAAGNYNLQASGGSHLQLNGNIGFDTAIETAASGRKYALIELSLENSQITEAHSMGFLISQPGRSVELSSGTYRISRNSTGYFPYFDGVFGFANIDSLGESPFFAMEGTIIVSHIDPYSLEGSLEVTFRNGNSKHLKIKGKFNALKGKLR